MIILPNFALHWECIDIVNSMSLILHHLVLQSDCITNVSSNLSVALHLEHRSERSRIRKLSNKKN